MDKIIINRMEFYGYHGLFPEENKLGQRFFVDVEIFLDLEKPGSSDCMEDSIDYGQVYETVKAIMEGEPKNLIEAAAEQVASELLAAFAKLTACTIKVTKPDPPIPGHYQSVAVEIFRERAK
ncbi:dihydroneopterin aldolase [Virgibacillus dakarensis]|uniref:7,8-dihydroneopterin aldolase n=1 Tax=Lentibacillus populi TaxID=1827502 RepID=A0A9W5TZG1_9BACI|nr:MULTISPECIES: dihydroneopterin aldolase [Bacillaceae]MBT2218176.1 dihydroneopterin aldolase [Virgibacillus dakarensis]MTW86540.1 dihydroneopterin aldolase [Virgibacillus dakarensis]GGB51304.1 7,8-dihydroneopterin aldolase [Lentibacillus populi]